MGYRIVKIFLALTCVTFVMGSLIPDPDFSVAIERVINEDYFALHISQESELTESLLDNTEPLFLIEFPEINYKLEFSAFERNETTIIVVEIWEDGKPPQSLAVDVPEDYRINFLTLAVDQNRPGTHIEVYVNCLLYATWAISKTPKDYLSRIRRPSVHALRSSDYTIRVYAGREVIKSLCPYSTVNVPHYSDKPSIITDPNSVSLNVTVYEKLLKDIYNYVNVEKERCEQNSRALDTLKSLINNETKRSVANCFTSELSCFPSVPCIDTREGPICGRCPRGYTGDGIQCRTQIPRCSDYNPCFTGVECRDTYHGPECGSCPRGYTGNGTYCTRIINGCQNNPCHSRARCFNIREEPYYKCVCLPGYTGDGIRCSELFIDECTVLNPCPPNVDCINLYPGHRCGGCPPGYTGGLTCVDIDECASGRVCVPHSQCVNTQGSFYCTACEPGYIGNQTAGCTAIVAPEPITMTCTKDRNCDKNARCIRLDWRRYSYCQCNIGYAGDGFACNQDTDLDGIADNVDNCPYVPNSGQEDYDMDRSGNACDQDPDGDGIYEDDKCPIYRSLDQSDWDEDDVGDVCDNCRIDKNSDQSDIDKDGIGDVCDADIDNDGFHNDQDNCPRVENPRQTDLDRDGVGDACDNCPKIYNPDQADFNQNLIGDVCEGHVDTDRDGVADNIDNCKTNPNPDQLDTDEDGLGDVCDIDLDQDGVPNTRDNCVLIYNPDQRDSNRNGIGDLCEGDYDGDGVKNNLDNCPNNSLIQQTDFTNYKTIEIDPEGDSQPDPVWEVRHKGREVYQNLNSNPGLLIGPAKFLGVDFEGTFYVNTDEDDDYIGFVFSYQSNRKFYTVMWKRYYQTYWHRSSPPVQAIAMSGLQIKVVNSETGPSRVLANALYHTGDTLNQVRTLWKDPKNTGWRARTPYRWSLIHRPSIGLIRLRVYDGSNILVDSGNIFDVTHQGGNLGLLAFSQERVSYSNLLYRCNENLNEEAWKDLSQDIRGRIQKELY